MALTTNVRRNKWYIAGTLIDATTVDADGGWQRIDGIFPFAISVEGDFDGTVTLYATSSPTAPFDSNDNHTVLQTFAGVVGGYNIAAPYEFIKAALVGNTTGTCTVYATASQAETN